MFIILIGIGLIRAPLNFWPGVLLIFLIRIGIRTPSPQMWQEGDALVICVSSYSKQDIRENGPPGIIGGFIRERGGPGFPGIVPSE
jgi:hypothetical protein